MINSLIGLVALVCAVWVIYDVVVNNKKLKQTSKILWIVFAVIFSIITAIVYYFVHKTK
jgi:uncharacterized BrkB/YihY/UPF0761 family membrane protein